MFVIKKTHLSAFANLQFLRFVRNLQARRRF